jgi:hypothetical protein
MKGKQDVLYVHIIAQSVLDREHLHMDVCNDLRGCIDSAILNLMNNHPVVIYRAVGDISSRAIGLCSQGDENVVVKTYCNKPCSDHVKSEVYLHKRTNS